MNFGITSSNYSNNDVGSMVKSMGLNAASEYFGYEYSGLIQQYLSGQISESDLISGLGNQVVNGLVNKTASSIFSLVENAISNAYNNAGKAQKDVNDHNEAIEKANERANEIAKISDENLRKAVEEIDNQTSNIQDIIKQAEEMIGANLNNEEVQIAYLQTEINKNVELLNSEDTNEEDKQDIIDTIAGLGDQIVETATAMNQTITEAIEQSQADVLTCSKLITEQIDNAVGIISQNLQNIKGVEVQTTAEGNTNITLDNAAGTQEGAEASALQAKAAGEAAFSFSLLGGVAAVSDEAKVADLLAASSTHISGAAEEMTKLGSALGSMEGMSSEITYAINMVGQAGTTAAGLIGSFETVTAGAISAIGSLDSGVAEARETLTSNIEDYEKAQQTPEVGEDGEQEENQLVVKEDLFTKFEVKNLNFGI